MARERFLGRWAGLAVAALVGSTLPVLLATPVLAHPGSAIISNGTVQMGVWDEGHLNVPGGVASPQGTSTTGLRFEPTGNEATAAGCLCEGWGVGDFISSVTGYANEATDGVVNLAVESFVSDGDSATSVTLVKDVAGVNVMRVTHDYQPATATPNLYAVAVTIENVSSAAIDPRYRRVMDWDVEPTPFNEFSTIQGTAGATAVSFSSNDGFASANPLSGPSDGGFTGDFVDAGPRDHGALFDFDFASLAPGASQSFTTFYGAAATEIAANNALAAVGAEVYAYGQPSTPDGPTLGAPNTFIFAFDGIGGAPVFPEICDNGLDDDRDGFIDGADSDCVRAATPTVTTYAGPAGVQYSDSIALSGTLIDSAGGVADKTLGFGLGTQSTTAGPTDAAGAASTGLVVTQQPGTVSSVVTSFAGDAAYTASSDTDPFTVLKEDCRLTYSGPVLVPALTGATLTADLGEPDTSLGDLRGKTVIFTVVDASMTTQTFTAVTDAAGGASTTQPLPAGVYAVTATFAGDDFYLACATAEDTLVTVAAAGVKVTGGGWFINDSRTSFGLNLIPEPGGLFKGQLQLRRTSTKSRFHGNTASGGTVVAPNTVQWTGTGRWNGETGYTFRVTAFDGGTSGRRGDTIDIVIFRTGSPSTAVYTSGGTKPLKGGNLVVH